MRKLTAGVLFNRLPSQIGKGDYQVYDKIYGLGQFIGLIGNHSFSYPIQCRFQGTVRHYDKEGNVMGNTYKGRILYTIPQAKQMGFLSNCPICNILISKEHLLPINQGLCNNCACKADHDKTRLVGSEFSGLINDSNKELDSKFNRFSELKEGRETKLLCEPEFPLELIEDIMKGPRIHNVLLRKKWQIGKSSFKTYCKKWSMSVVFLLNDYNRIYGYMVSKQAIKMNTLFLDTEEICPIGHFCFINVSNKTFQIF